MGHAFAATMSQGPQTRSILQYSSDVGPNGLSLIVGLVRGIGRRVPDRNVGQCKSPNDYASDTMHQEPWDHNVAPRVVFWLLGYPRHSDPMSFLARHAKSLEVGSEKKLPCPLRSFSQHTSQTLRLPNGSSPGCSTPNTSCSGNRRNEQADGVENTFDRRPWHQSGWARTNKAVSHHMRAAPQGGD